MVDKNRKKCLDNKDDKFTYDERYFKAHQILIQQEDNEIDNAICTLKRIRIKDKSLNNRVFR